MLQPPVRIFSLLLLSRRQPPASCCVINCLSVHLQQHTTAVSRPSSGATCFFLFFSAAVTTTAAGYTCPAARQQQYLVVSSTYVPSEGQIASRCCCFCFFCFCFCSCFLFLCFPCFLRFCSPPRTFLPPFPFVWLSKVISEKTPWDEEPLFLYLAHQSVHAPLGPAPIGKRKPLTDVPGILLLTFRGRLNSYQVPGTRYIV